MKGVPSKLAEDHVANATACTLCGSGNLGRFVAETCIHFQGLENIDKPTVLVFPELVVCLDCGFTTFAPPEEQLGFLAILHGQEVPLLFPNKPPCWTGPH
jgi:hypothetical protein